MNRELVDPKVLCNQEKQTTSIAVIVWGSLCIIVVIYTTVGKSNFFMVVVVVSRLKGNQVNIPEPVTDLSGNTTEPGNGHS